VILAHLGGQDPRSTDPLGACSTNRIPSVYRCHPPAADPKPTAANPNLAAEAPALALQAIQRRADHTGWGAEAYMEVARWCHRYRPQHTGLWLRLALGVAL
jgi:hypothetical protein